MKYKLKRFSKKNIADKAGGVKFKGPIPRLRISIRIAYADKT